jgi:phospholipid/cholesterol/gamma-HCH transport system ATP-binding protein
MNDRPEANSLTGRDAAAAAPGATPKIAIRGLTKVFGDKVVLDGVDLDIVEGESMLVIGGSGSGKSVLLKCILGLLHPDAGSIKVDGEEVVGLYGADLDRVRRKFGMLFQNAALFDSLPVWENVAFGLIQGQRLARDKAREIALQKLAAVGLDEAVGLLTPAELSGGMRKRVGLARAIATEPEIIFFDEPTTGLDPIMGDVIDRLIVKCVKELGATALSITHDMASARRISDRVAMLYKGKIIWTGRTAEIDHSGNPYVDQFIHGREEGPIQMQVRDL